MHYDTLIKNGEVVDPGGRSGKLDVAILNGRIAAVDADIAAGSADHVIDASGRYVTPGLIDLHTHVYYGVTYWGVRADPLAARSGVTTWFDAGSAGGYNLLGFKEFIAEPAAAHIYSFLNISSIGLTAETGELANPLYWDTDLCCTLVEQNRDLVRGIKVRVDRDTTGGTGVGALAAARRAAEDCALPLMVHIGKGPPEIGEVLPFLNPGDILTHCFTGNSMRITDGSGRLLDDVRRVRDSGVVLDLGHGAGSFSFDTAEALMGEGHLPDVISSDSHQVSVHGPMFDLPTCMSKCMMLGMSLSDVVKAATENPARVMGLFPEYGTLSPGSAADVAVFELESRDAVFYDVGMSSRTGKQLLRNTLTLADGRSLPKTDPDPQVPWLKLTADQKALLSRGHAFGCSD